MKNMLRMLRIGHNIFPSAFIKNIELADKAILIRFHLNRAVKINFKNHEKAVEEYEKAVDKFEKTRKPL